MTNQTESHFVSQDDVDKRVIALAALDRLVELGEVRYCVERECLYWVASGEDLRCPF